MSDILIYLVRLAEMCQIDLPSAVTKKFALNAQKYPADKVCGSSHKYSAYTNEQWHHVLHNHDIILYIKHYHVHMARFILCCVLSINHHWSYFYGESTYTMCK